jgi:hypothetical protein
MVICTCAPVAERVVLPLQGVSRRCTAAAIDGSLACRQTRRRQRRRRQRVRVYDSGSVAQQVELQELRPVHRPLLLGVGSTIWPELQAAPSTACSSAYPLVRLGNISMECTGGAASRAVVARLCREGMPAAVRRLWQRPQQVCPARVIAVSLRTCCFDTSLVLCRARRHIAECPVACSWSACKERCSSEGRVRCRGVPSVRGRGRGCRCWVGVLHNRRQPR